MARLLIAAGNGLGSRSVQTPQGLKARSISVASDVVQERIIPDVGELLAEVGKLRQAVP